ncbi:MAG TPA: SIR2 family protein [Actinomycetota bacterium]|nr:SIR2 family protein [Actinomycetota bacterium]
MTKTLMDSSEFVRLHYARAPGLVWFLGAGASASAGIPTAGAMVWEFKRSIYCSRMGVPVTAVPDLGDDQVRRRIQAYFDDLGSFPPAGADDEYACYFEYMHASESDRRAIIDSVVQRGAATFGHRALGALAATGRIPLIVTTNFDPLVEDGVAQVTGSTGSLTVVKPDAHGVGMDALSESRFPLLVKLHGDFRSSRLKNTSNELRTQDAQLREMLVSGLADRGLVVVGCSGRDGSVVEAIRRAIVSGGVKRGLFWLLRGGDEPPHTVVQLLHEAYSRGLEACPVRIGSFDEVAGDLLAMEDLPTGMAERLAPQRDPRRVVPTPIRRRGTDWPVVRLNAVPFIALPPLFRFVDCSIGGSAEVRQAVENAGADVLAARSRRGVICFGGDEAVRKSFSPYGITSFGVSDVIAPRLGHRSTEAGLVFEALSRALTRCRPLRRAHEKSRHLFVVSDVSDQSVSRLKASTGDLVGRIPGTSLRWAEGVRVRIDHRLGRTWLCYEPVVWAEPIEGADAGVARAKFVRERLVRRFNRQTFDLLDAWAEILTGPQLVAFDVPEGVDARFELDSRSAFSRRERA